MNSAEIEYLKINDADSYDLQCLFEIECAAHSHPWTASMLEESLKGTHIVKKLNSETDIAGFFILLDGGDFWEVLDIVVAPQYQSKGLGKHMLKRIIESAINAKKEKVFLEVRESNLVAQSLYRKCGFKIISTRKKYYRTNQGREDGLVMMVELISVY